MGSLLHANLDYGAEGARTTVVSLAVVNLAVFNLAIIVSRAIDLEWERRSRVQLVPINMSK